MNSSFKQLWWASIQLLVQCEGDYNEDRMPQSCTSQLHSLLQYSPLFDAASCSKASPCFSNSLSIIDFSRWWSWRRPSASDLLRFSSDFNFFFFSTRFLTSSLAHWSFVFDKNWEKFPSQKFRQNPKAQSDTTPNYQEGISYHRTTLTNFGLINSVLTGCFKFHSTTSTIFRTQILNLTVSS